VRVRLLVAVLLLGVAAAAFAGGRASAGDRPAPVARGSFTDGYESAFSGFDGGWAYDTPYIVTLRRGRPGTTYRFARRWAMAPRTRYRACGRSVCTDAGS
jgi:hypothetical protein